MVLPPRPDAAQQPLTEDWPPLVPLHAPPLPPLTADFLPSWAGAFARALALDTETPEELSVAMVLAACSTATARRLRVCLRGDYSEPTNLWTAVHLPSGNRKSAVQNGALQPLTEWEILQETCLREEIQRIKSERLTREGRIKQLRAEAGRASSEAEARRLVTEIAEAELQLPPIPVIPRLWTSDVTPERLGSLLAEQDECLGWHSSEAGIFEQLAGRYSGGIPNLDLVLKAHSGDPERVDRGSRPALDLVNPRLTICIVPQTDVLQGLAAKPGFRGRGLLARFLYLLPTSPLGYRRFECRPIPTGVRRAYHAGLTAMLDWPAQRDERDRSRPYQVGVSDEAYQVWLEFALTIEKLLRPGQPMELFSDWGGKAPGAAVRIAGVLQGIVHAHGEPWAAVITAETMTQAVDIMAVISRHSLAALDLMDADPLIAGARHVWGWIERNHYETFSIREAFNALRGTFTRVVKLRAALDVLIERGYVSLHAPRHSGSGRRPSPVVQVRPDLVASW
ncbi:MAG: DUF3987 domain-containing protein [Gammaproteobacteria bacterium]|nr:DUF3987 domain-containing protein [Gammaproteobacteria bacterium]